MAFNFAPFDDPLLSEDYVAWLIEEHAPHVQARYETLWQYYRNELHRTGQRADENARAYAQAQEAGLPPRITGLQRTDPADPFAGKQHPEYQRKEVVIENDIAWRINVLVDFLFGQPLSVESLAPDPDRARSIEAILHAVLQANGGERFLQELALLGCVYGFADVLLRTAPDFHVPLTGADRQAARSDQELRLGKGPADARSKDTPPDRAARRTAGFDHVLQTARLVLLETVEAPRAFPIPDEDDCRTIRYYVQHFRKRLNRLDEKGAWGLFSRRRPTPSPASSEVTEIIGPHWWQRYEDGELTEEGPNPFGRLPLVHVQNSPQPFAYEGFSDVEPLIPLQDELNTRLSDRASRVTFQSFKMYLGKGINDFLERRVGPGQMWKADDPDATIEEFGGDAQTPSEREHIAEVRNALDKVSGVTPLAAGMLSGRIGHLTSAVALKITLMGTLAKTERKRLTYGKGIQQIADLVLQLLDLTGVWPNTSAERRIKIHWPSPLPENLSEKLEQAQAKRELGVPAETVLRELGYAQNA